MQGVGTVAVAVEPRSSWAHVMRSTLQSVSSLDGFRMCGRQWAREVRVVMAPTGETRRLGMHLCGCAHVCPVCWSRRRIQERAEIVYAGEQWLAAGAGLATMVLTVPHQPDEPLAAVMDRLEAWATVLRSGDGRRQLREWFGVEAILRATEVTWNKDGGWHPHQHLILWGRAPFDAPTRAGLFRWIRDRWRRRSSQNPHDPLYAPWPEHEEPYYVPADVHNIEPADLERMGGHITKGPSRSTEERWRQAKEAGNEELAAYLAPFAFGEQAAGGDPAALAAWLEYEAATAESQWIRWPNGWRARFGLGPAGRQPALEGVVLGSSAQTTAISG